MPHRRIMAAAVFAMAFVGEHAAAQVRPLPANRPFPPGFTNHVPVGDETRTRIQARLRELHDEAVALQKADGGTLTHEHHAQLTEKLEALRREACAAKLAGC